MSISSELLTLQNTKQAIKASINAKGGNITNSTPFADYSTAIDNLPSGGDNSTLIDLIERDITSINIPSGTTRIGQWAFGGCTSLTSVTIPNSVTEIAYQAFYNTRITSINLPNGVTSIGIGAFANCVNMASINLPSGVTSIGESAFETCRSLTSLILPSGVTSIGQKAFSGCTGLQYIVCLATTPPTLGGNNQYAYPFYSTQGPIYVPAASVDAYKAASGWSTYASRIFAIQQVATVDGNPVYNYELGMTSTSSINDTQLAKIPSGTSIEFAEGITEISAGTLGWANVTLPSTFASFGDQDQIGSTVSTITCWATTPPGAFRDRLGGANLTHIYVPASAVADYKADSTWSSFSSIIQAIPAPSITITEYEGQEVIDNAVDFGDFPGCVDDEIVPDEFAAASANSTFDSDLKAHMIVVEDDNGNDITSQCTFSSPDFSKWDSTQDPNWDGESPVDYEWRAYDTISSGDSQTPGSVSITATYGGLTDTVYLGYSKTDMGCEPDPEPEPDPEEPEEPE